VKATSTVDRGASGKAMLRVEVRFDKRELALRPTPLGLDVELEGCRPAGVPGGPALPRTVIAVALPPG
jgi:hypothetical protein